MRICFPTENDQGLDAPLAGHFGSAPYYTIRDTENETFETVNNQDHNHAHGQCAPVDRLKPHQLDAIVVGGIGKRAFMLFTDAGLKVYMTQTRTVRDALAELDAGTLRVPAFNELCGGHGDGHRGGGGCGS
jgi:predicted Fe-Mo cluster-binding NifX family protein